MSEVQAKILPFYLVIDVSYSMEGNNLDAANQIVPSLLDSLAQNPILSDKIRFALLDFSDDAQIRIPLCDLLMEERTPMLECRGGTSFEAPLRLLKREIRDNVAQLKGDGYMVHRPAVFFLSDGMPNDSWEGAFADLTQGDRMYPNIIPFGVAQADHATMQRLIHPSEGTKQMRMFMMDKGQDAAAAINSMAEIMISSVLASGMSMASGSSGHILPAEEQIPNGVTGYGADEDVDYL